MGDSGTGQRKIPEKRYFRIGEVADLVGVDAHVLRYWEREFPFIRPDRDISRQRLYRREDVKIIVRIKSLLHEHGYTISGARKLLEAGGAPEETRAAGMARTLARVRQELEDIRQRLRRP